MKNIFFLTALGFLFNKLPAQQNFGCLSHDVYTKQMATNAEFKKSQEQLEAETKLFVDSHTLNRTANATYVIPIVFHVIYTTAAGNISSAQIMDQVNILNKEFNHQQADTVLTPAAFKPAAMGFNVEFRLATKDPNGNCTNGITRVYSSLSNCSAGQDDVKAISYWPSNQYLNIWIVQNLHYSSMAINDCNSGGAYATFPGGAATLDGINMRGDLIGNIGTAATNNLWGNFKGRYLVHELGHWFNLHHIWGDANCGNDFVADTPPALTSNSGCPTFPHNPNNTCSGSGPNGEMFTDYMDYTNGPCLNMFTAGQVARMTAAITSSISGRNNLWSNANLIATGTSNPYAYPSACAVVPEIFPLTQIVACAGDSVTFTDNSYGGNATSRLWNFGGEPASSLTDSIVKVKYNVAGVYSPSLTKNYLNNSNTTTFTNKVIILSNTPNTNYVVPFQDDFEDPTNFYSDWTVINDNNDAVTWQLVSSTSFLGSSCVGIQNFGNIAPATDDLISPAYDLTAVTNATLSFMLHFSRVASVDYDKMQIFISSDCGQTWTSIYYKDNGLRTVATLNTSAYTPASGSAEWREERINISNAAGSGIVRFKFSFTSGGGNNLFIDDINIDGLNSTGIKSYNLNNNISLYPNPGNESVNLSFDIENQSPVKIEVIDIMGKVCQEQYINSIGTGKNKSVLNTGVLKDGVYLIRLKQNNQAIYNSKFIKQSAE